jgi:hypothetical protein
MVNKLETNRSYSASYFDPMSGERTEIGPIKVDSNGSWSVQPPAGAADWVVVLAPAVAQKN